MQIDKTVIITAIRIVAAPVTALVMLHVTERNQKLTKKRFESIYANIKTQNTLS